ncbi:MAG TPA: MFS transporter [Phycisphaerae bacterium]|nr:MFS transporter [Phycisphaerae bacterium]
MNPPIGSPSPPRWTNRLLVITFIESFATVCIERGAFFYGEHILKFTMKDNLLMALAFGLCYVTGALLSHRATSWLTERKVLISAIIAQAVIHIFMGVHITAITLVAGNAILGLVNGLKWPVVESYITAGLDHVQTSKVVGKFNMSWAGSIPLAVAAVGFLVELHPSALFLAAGLLNILALGIAWTLHQQPYHMPEDHPARPDPVRLASLKRLMYASRFLLLSSYGLMYVLAASLPYSLKGLGYGIQIATALAALMDVARIGAFGSLQRWSGWHDKQWPLWITVILLPAGFYMTHFAPSTAMIITGELLFGFTAGIVYYCALYYAMVAKNASVEASGAHEGLIGLGFALGPAAALIGIALASSLGSELNGTAATTALMILACSIPACMILLRRGKIT